LHEPMSQLSRSVRKLIAAMFLRRAKWEEMSHTGMARNVCMVINGGLKKKPFPSLVTRNQKKWHKPAARELIQRVRLHVLSPGACHRTRVYFRRNGSCASFVGNVRKLPKSAFGGLAGPEVNERRPLRPLKWASNGGFVGGTRRVRQLS
jgi:hypothetical protein